MKPSARTLIGCQPSTSAQAQPDDAPRVTASREGHDQGRHADGAGSAEDVAEARRSQVPHQRNARSRR